MAGEGVDQAVWQRGVEAELNCNEIGSPCG
jgi:hypothetical protein